MAEEEEAEATAVRTATVVDMDSGEGIMLETGTAFNVWIVDCMPVG